ncbi:hypothetical protein ACFXG4_32170 [Nocardia sp. NPDC059246]
MERRPRSGGGRHATGLSPFRSQGKRLDRPESSPAQDPLALIDSILDHQ